MPTVISGDKSGRLVSYDPRSKEVKVLMSELTYPNGVAVSRDSSYLLVTETTTCRILRYSLKPTEIKVAVLVKLPGFPDNIKPSPRGGFWVAFYSRRGKLTEWLLSFPLWLREVFIWLPLDLNGIFSLFSRWLGKPMAMRISEEGEVLQVLENFGGEIVKYISDVEEKNGTLWIGSVVMPHVGVYKL